MLFYTFLGKPVHREGPGANFEPIVFVHPLVSTLKPVPSTSSEEVSPNPEAVNNNYADTKMSKTDSAESLIASTAQPGMS